MKQANQGGEPAKKFAAVCGLYCEACNLYIGTHEDPARIAKAAARFNVEEDEVTCYGCRSDKKALHCNVCKIYSCAGERGIDVCGECSDYPCENLKEFQLGRPHRNDLWEDLAYYKEHGYEKWLQSLRAKYTCSKCGTINSPYDLKCRKCAAEPSCAFVAKHFEALETDIKNASANAWKGK